MDSNLVKRIGFAAVAIPLALGVVWLGGWALALVVAAVAALGAGELYSIAEKTGTKPLRRTGMTLAFMTPLTLEAAKRFADSAAEGFTALCILGLPLATMLVLSIALVRRTPEQRPLGAVAITLFGLLYTALLPAFLLLIRSAHPTQSWDGAWLVFFPLITTWVCDTAAMFGGRAFGKNKLAPRVSPGKTREGAVAGVVGGVIIGAAYGYFMPDLINPSGSGIGVAIAKGVIIAAILSVVGQVGDLVESLFKREAGVKDSSTLIPGHGGVLDRFDSLYFVLPVAAILFALFGAI